MPSSFGNAGERRPSGNGQAVSAGETAENTAANRWENSPQISGRFRLSFIREKEKGGFLRLSQFGTLPAK
jgi:hypothetical protein